MRQAIGTQAGFSLISLLIASAIGIFIMGGAGKVYIDSKNTFNARSSVSAATENYRFAIQDLRRTIVMAGRSIIPENDDTTAYSQPDTDALRTFPAVGSGGIEDENNGSSVVAIRYASGPAPCGLDVVLDGTTNPVTARFFVDVDGNLICEGTLGSQTISQPLVSGIARMRALYGVDTDGDGIANQYLSATVVDTNSRWVNVVAIRIGIVTGSGDGQEMPVMYRPSVIEPLDIMGMEYTPTDSTQAFKSANVTIQLRNLHQSMNRQATNFGG